MGRFRWRPTGATLAACGVVGAAAVVRLLFLLSNIGRMDGDEAASGVMAQRILDGDSFVYFAGQTYGGALEQYLQAAVLALTPDTPTTLRLVQWALSVTTCALIYRLGSRVLGSPWRGVLAAALFAVWPFFNVVWGIKSRGGYVSGQMLSVVIVLLALEIGARERSVFRPLSLGLGIGLALWQSLLALYVVLPALVWVLGTTRGRWREVLPVTLGGAMLGAAPAIGFQITHGLALLGDDQPPSSFVGRLDALVDNVLGIWLGFAQAGGAATFSWWSPRLVVALAVCGLAIGALVRRRGMMALVALRTGDRRPIDLVLAILIVAPVLYAASPYAWYSGEPRYLFTLYPFLAVALAGLARGGPRVAVAVAAVLVAGGSALTATTAVRVHQQGCAGGPVSQGGLVLPDDLPGVVEVLAQEGVTSVYADYWLAYQLQFAAGDRLAVAPYVTSRFPALTAAVARDPRAAFAAVRGPGADQLSKAFAARRVRATRLETGTVSLFVDTNTPQTPAGLGVIPDGTPASPVYARLNCR